MKLFLTLFITFISFNSIAEQPDILKQVMINDYSTNKLSTTRNKNFEFSIDIKTAQTLSIDIVSADKDKVKTIFKKTKVKPGNLKLSWDGKDEKGIFVPDEAWYPAIHIYNNDKVTSIYPSDYSGGEVMDELPVTVVGAKQINLTLSKPARLLVRAGLKSGPMLRSLSSWEVKEQGLHKIYWDGLDESKVYPFTTSDDFGVMATAFQLPDHAIITYGNKQLSYSQWRLQSGFSQNLADSVANISAKRNGKALSKVFFKPKYLPTDPRVTAKLLNTKGDIPTLSGVSSLKVDIPLADRGIVEKSLYEVGFFVDGVFVSEEEQGYVPFTWRFDPKQFSAGEHHLTVNISGFDGQVGIVSLKFKTQ